MNRSSQDIQGSPPLIHVPLKQSKKETSATSTFSTNSMSVNDGGYGEFGVGVGANANCPADFPKIPLIIHQNTPFQTKNSFFSAEGPRLATKLAGSAPPAFPEFQPDLRL